MKKFLASEYKDVVNDWSDYNLSFADAIKAKCLDCCCYDSKEVKLCDCKSCSLYLIKENNFKHNKINLSEEERKRRAEQLKANRKH